MFLARAAIIAFLLVSLGGSCRSGTPDSDNSAVAPAMKAERLTRDTPRTTIAGNRFIAPAGWSMAVRGRATILEPPEENSAIALIDLQAPSAEAAVAAAWKEYRADAKWPVRVVNPWADGDGWMDRATYEYQISPNEKRDVRAIVQRAGGTWTVFLADMPQAIAEKRLSQILLIYNDLLPRGYTRESFTGKKAHRLNQARIAQLGQFVESAMKDTKVPGVAVGLIQNGKTVFAGGFGTRELGTTQPVDANTMFMVASNTKAMTSLMLAKLVDQKKITWDTPVTDLLPWFKLGDPETTRGVRVKYLICACTGMPRQDLEFDFNTFTPETAVRALATMQPTSKFGELFQYSNLLAAAAGYVGGHVAFPDMELGSAYDSAMSTLVFQPLEMRATTFDFEAAQRGDHARPHAPDVDGNPTRALMGPNYLVISERPSGGAWSNVGDMLAYISMELAEGKLPDGKQYISRDVLLARRAAQVPFAKDVTYGMGLAVTTKYGVTVVSHGGDLVGYHSDMMWLPEHGVGAVVLTNGDPGWLIRDGFRRKLLEVLFDGRPEAAAQVAANARVFYQGMAADRKLLTVPADSDEVVKLAKRYHSDALGDIVVSHNQGVTVFDIGEWKSEVGTRRNPDGTVSFITTLPGMIGYEFVVGSGGKRTLTVRDAQHEYVFTEM
jgi:CubicO group peptidase (beta-lactamase class C family)